MEEVLRQNFKASDSDLCNRCAEERMQEGRIKVKSWSRSASPILETRIEVGETQEMTCRNILNVKEKPVTKVDRLIKDALGWDTETATYDKTKVTKVSWEDQEVMILQLKDEKLGPVWRQTQGPDRRRSIQLMMIFPRRSQGRRRPGDGGSSQRQQNYL